MGVAKKGIHRLLGDWIVCGDDDVAGMRYEPDYHPQTHDSRDGYTYWYNKDGIAVWRYRIADGQYELRINY